MSLIARTVSLAAPRLPSHFCTDLARRASVILGFALRTVLYNVNRYYAGSPSVETAALPAYVEYLPTKTLPYRLPGSHTRDMNRSPLFSLDDILTAVLLYTALLILTAVFPLVCYQLKWHIHLPNAFSAAVAQASHIYLVIRHVFMVAVQAATRLYVVHIHGVVASRLSSTARRVDVFARNTRMACALAYAGLVSHISSYIFASFDCITSAPHRLRSHASRIYSSAIDSLVRHTLPFIRYHSLSSILAVVDDVKNDTSFTIRKATSTLAFILAVYADVKNVISSFINATFNLPLILAISDYIKNLFSSSTTAICALRPQEELTISLSLPSFRLSLVSTPRVKTYNACGVCTDAPVLVARAVGTPKTYANACSETTDYTLSPPRPSTKIYASRSACTDAPECPPVLNLPTVATTAGTQIAIKSYATVGVQHSDEASMIDASSPPSLSSSSPSVAAADDDDDDDIHASFSYDDDCDALVSSDMSVSTESISPPTAPISISTGPTNADLRLAVPADQAVPAELILPGGDDDPADLSLADADELKTYQAGFFAAGEAARDASEASSFQADASSYKADPSSFSVDSSSLTATTATQAPLPHLPLPPIPRRFSHSPRDRDIYCWGYYDHAFVGVLAKRGAGDRLYDEYMMGMLGSEQDVLGKHTSALGKHMSPPSDEVRAYRVGWLDAKYVTANPVQSKVRSSYWAGGFRRAHIDKFDAAYNYKHRND